MKEKDNGITPRGIWYAIIKGMMIATVINIAMHRTPTLNIICLTIIMVSLYVDLNQKMKRRK